jgi:Holliday junction resolvase RusA-like endonuclease
VRIKHVDPRSGRVVARFDAVGVPIQQGSKDLLPSRGGAVMVEAQNRKGRVRKANALKTWRQTIAWMARSSFVGVLVDGDIALSATFRLPRPRSVLRSRPNVKPDLAKLVRALEDALTGIVWTDDSRVVRYDQIEKVYADGCEPGASVVIMLLPEEGSHACSAV